MRCLVVISILLVSTAATAKPSKKVYQKDVKFALDQIAKECKVLIKSKGIKWAKVKSRFLKEAKKVKTDEDHYFLLCRLIAALRDGHAYVKAPDALSRSIKWPFDLKSGPGVFLCETPDGIYVKNAWSGAAKSGVKAGMKVVAIDKVPAAKWLDARVAELSEYHSFSTEHQARFFACHRGLGGPAGSSIKLELQDARGKKKKVNLSRSASTVPAGPAVFPENLSRAGRMSYGKLPSGFGYVHLRDTKRAVVEQMNQALEAIGPVPGMILDFRANGGGSFNHDALLGHFVPPGKSMSRSGARPIPSAGTKPFGGPVVVIVDSGVCSAGETGSGMFKEDGRGYMIGEGPTAGMSSSKTTIELPSQRFSLFVSVYSNKGRFQGGRGIEGIGIEPHEVVPYDPADLEAGTDTLIKRAEALLRDFPQKKVPYRPHQHGWEPPK